MANLTQQTDLQNATKNAPKWAKIFSVKEAFFRRFAYHPQLGNCVDSAATTRVVNAYSRRKSKINFNGFAAARRGIHRVDCSA
jgi:hypothetical protein